MRQERRWKVSFGPSTRFKARESYLSALWHLADPVPPQRRMSPVNQRQRCDRPPNAPLLLPPFALPLPRLASRRRHVICTLCPLHALEPSLALISIPRPRLPGIQTLFQLLVLVLDVCLSVRTVVWKRLLRHGRGEKAGLVFGGSGAGGGGHRRNGPITPSRGSVSVKDTG